MLTHQQGAGRPLAQGHRKLIISRGGARYTFNPEQMRVIVLAKARGDYFERVGDSRPWRRGTLHRARIVWTQNKRLGLNLVH